MLSETYIRFTPMSGSTPLQYEMRPMSKSHLRQILLHQFSIFVEGREMNNVELEPHPAVPSGQPGAIEQRARPARIKWISPEASGGMGPCDGARDRRLGDPALAEQYLLHHAAAID